MPEGSGFELLEINDLTKTLVVFVTAHSEYAIQAIKKDAFDYLLKPLQINELTRVINKARKKIETFQIRDVEPLKIKIKLDGKVCFWILPKLFISVLKEITQRFF